MMYNVLVFYCRFITKLVSFKNNELIVALCDISLKF